MGVLSRFAHRRHFKKRTNNSVIAPARLLRRRFPAPTSFGRMCAL